MSVSMWAPLLEQLKASWVKHTPGDYGREGVYEEVIPEFICYGRKLRSEEQIAAGVEAATISYRLYMDLPLHPKLTEAAQLTLTDDDASLGTFNVRSVGDAYPDNTTEVDVDRLSTQ